MKKYILFFAVSLFLYSCIEKKAAPAPANAAPKATVQQANKTTSQVAAGATVSPYWSGLQTNLGVGAQQIQQLKDIQTKYESEIQSLRAQGKWAGANNAKNRQDFVSRKNKDIENVLGKQLAKKKEVYDNIYRIKLASGVK